MKINELVELSHKTAKEKGWWDSPREDGTLLMLMVGELAEAMEEMRNDKPGVYFNTEQGPKTPEQIASGEVVYYNPKPEGGLIELADTIVRIADYIGHKGWDLEEALKLKMEYNKTREQRHGGKKF
jgi:NTP pyrophosphatase (non-canonical NTP hydrolase)